MKYKNNTSTISCTNINQTEAMSPDKFNNEYNIEKDSSDDEFLNKSSVDQITYLLQLQELQISCTVNVCISLNKVWFHLLVKDKSEFIVATQVTRYDVPKHELKNAVANINNSLNLGPNNTEDVFDRAIDVNKAIEHMNELHKSTEVIIAFIINKQKKTISIRGIDNEYGEKNLTRRYNSACTEIVKNVGIHAMQYTFLFGDFKIVMGVLRGQFIFCDHMRIVSSYDDLVTLINDIHDCVLQGEFFTLNKRGFLILKNQSYKDVHRVVSDLMILDKEIQASDDTKRQNIKNFVLKLLFKNDGSYFQDFTQAEVKDVNGTYNPKTKVLEVGKLKLQMDPETEETELVNETDNQETKPVIEEKKTKGNFACIVCALIFMAVIVVVVYIVLLTIKYIKKQANQTSEIQNLEVLTEDIDVVNEDTDVDVKTEVLDEVVDQSVENEPINKKKEEDEETEVLLKKDLLSE